MTICMNDDKMRVSAIYVCMHNDDDDDDDDERKWKNYE